VPDVGEQFETVHHKFAVRDGEEIWTGSWDLTAEATYQRNNNAVRMHSPSLATVYTREFETMFVERKFGRDRGSGPGRGNVTLPIQVGPLRVRTLFAVNNGVTQWLVNRIAQAQSEIRFVWFSFSRDGIGTAMLERAKAGIQVTGIYEDGNDTTQLSEYDAIEQAGLGLRVYRVGAQNGVHNVFVIDGRTTIFGAFALTDSYDWGNDENALIVDDPTFASRFLEEVERMLALARTPSTSSPAPIALAPPPASAPTLIVPTPTPQNDLRSSPESTPTGLATTAVVPGMVVVVRGTGGSGARMRAQAGSSGSIIAVAPEYTPLVVIGPDRQVDGMIWRNVRAPNGAEGWIAASFVTTGQ
jgi:phosphatidylserine/phosphatidylglycerophosphate/cardiolipin synthase-like enzyme